ncbi:MAG: hypothetical protein H9W81_18390, partial [Enterococcus sp.]|nr:hypothetical protein [Enterococcus sp.]
MNAENLAQLHLDVSKWLDTHRSDIPVTVRHKTAKLVEASARNTNWVKVCDETDLGLVGDDYIDQLELIQADIKRAVPRAEPL